ncbi:MAG: hypothetical protein M1838_002489 [Thelocarpon superellum]|nr:MAG: hypothetical protein M1838_002489 [Thelocarpon superellum]
MSHSTRELLLKVRRMVPPMLEKFHKGADMSHVICEPQAAQVIKTYSPNLMVHPYMLSTQHTPSDEARDDTLHRVSSAVIAMLSRLHVLVIGPGLGRDSLMQDTCARVIEAARERNLPFILDADGLYLAQTRPELVQGYPLCILTPNVVEFGRLAKSKGIDMASITSATSGSGPGAKDEQNNSSTAADEENDAKHRCARLASAFGGVTIIQKGALDYISDGSETLVSDLEGGFKRSGGQGDTLTGSLATFLAWRKAYLDGIWE